MTDRPLLLHAHDADITLYATGDDRVSSPGIAHMGKHGLQLGLEAKDLARRFPKSHHNQFWRSVLQNPISGEDRIDRTEAELVYAHLQSLMAALSPDTKKVVLAVPGHHDRNTLSLLLGIVEACGLEPVGLVHAGLLQSAHLQPQPEARYVEMHLAHTTISEMSPIANDRHGVSKTLSYDALGMDDLLRHWIEGLAEEFIHQTRYNPLHSPEGEQQLYDLLWRVKGSELPISLSLSSGSKTYDIELEPKQWANMSDAFINALIPQLSDSQHLILGPRLSNMAFIADSLKSRFTTDCIASDTIWNNYSRCWPHTAMGRENLMLARELGIISHTAVAQSQPTHLVINAVAWTLDKELFLGPLKGALALQTESGAVARLFSDGADHFIAPLPNAHIRINATPLKVKTQLNAGDEITLDNTTGHALIVREASYGT